MAQLEVTRQQFEIMSGYYRSLITRMPEELAGAMPSFELFMSPANWSHFHVNRDVEELSITGTKRWHALLSPHAKTILCAYAVQRLGNDNKARKL